MRTLASFKNVHQGQGIVVCGCGESLNQLAHPERFLTIGVNDVGRLFHPNYLVVLNPRNQFSGDRFRYVEDSKAEYLFTQLDLGIPHPNIVMVRLGAYAGTDFSNPEVLSYTQNSPYVALCLAAHMGAKLIGVIGVDFTDHHFFAKTGVHSLTRSLAGIDRQYGGLGDALRARRVDVFNLSEVSRLTAFPKLSIDEFALRADKPLSSISTLKDQSSAERALHRHPTESPLSIVSYATTPVAGVPAILARCINARTNHNARCVWARDNYGNGVGFQGEIQWSDSPAEAESAIRSADLLIVHNGRVDPRHAHLVAEKPIITMAHNYMWNVDQSFVKRGLPGVVVGQYQATLSEFKGWSVVPNPVPIWEDEFSPGEKAGDITICYTPSGRHERYPPGHKLYWHSKGYETTMRLLDSLVRRFQLRIEATGKRQVSHAQSLAMKRRSHIVIDECVTGSYHRNSLEGLAAGCVVVNGVGLLPGVVDVFHHCSKHGAESPFVRASLEDLEAVLASLIGRGAACLVEEGSRSRLWIEQHWDFMKQWEQFWWPVVALALERVPSRRPLPKPAPQSALQSEKRISTPNVDEVSVVIPFGGTDRLPQLIATIENLRNVSQVREIIVVEMGELPVAADQIRPLADKYVFVENHGVFHKARAMNVGLSLVQSALLMWLDGDLIVPRDFLDKAIAELRSRNLDCLIPWTSVRYLSQQDSEQVIRGVRSATQCAVVNLLQSRRGACGAAALVRQNFVRQYGGMCEEFRGWGGEDNAWFHKVRVLGRVATTARTDQHLFHLYHEQSGGYDSKNHRSKNPYYDRNVELLRITRSLSNRTSFLARFPVPSTFTCPWDRDLQIILVSDPVGELRWAPAAQAALNNSYGIDSQCMGANEFANWYAERKGRSDFVVVFLGAGTALGILSGTDWALHCRAVVVHDEFSSGLKDEDWTRLAGARQHVTADARIAGKLRELGLIPSLYHEDTKQDSACQVLALTQAISVVVARTESQTDQKGEVCPMTIARTADLSLLEFAAFNQGANYPLMRRWELPFALFQLQLSGTMSVLDCTINPIDFKVRLQSLFPHVSYRHWQPIQGGQFALPFGVPDCAFDRAMCVNTLEHLLAPQRDALIAELSRKLKSGGRLVVTCDHYFDSFWERPELHKMGVMRADRTEIFNGWNRVTPIELLEICRRHGLSPIGESTGEPDQNDSSLYRNIEPYPHACIGAVFCKDSIPLSREPRKKLVLSLLTWNTKDLSIESVEAYAREARMLDRLGVEPAIIVCDNGSNDGTRQALEQIGRQLEVAHTFIFNDRNRGSSIARNQIIDATMEMGGDYLLFMDGDIEIVPFSSFAMFRHMENHGRLLGCVGPHSWGFSPNRHETTRHLFSLEGCRIDTTHLVAWTQYGLFRCEVFDSGVRFDETEPFDREGWGFEDNDLAFQMYAKGYHNHVFTGIRYLHRNVHSSMKSLRAQGVNPRVYYEQRRHYILRKWEHTQLIDSNVLQAMRISSCPAD